MRAGTWRSLCVWALIAAGTGVAWADISDSGNLAVGGQAVVAGSVTVQGSAFSVGGSTFQVAGGSITLGGRLNVAEAGIKWTDGTVQLSSPTSAASSTTANSMPQTITTVGTGGPCVAGSTLTLSVDAGCRIGIAFVGAWTNNSSIQNGLLAYLVDGQFEAPWSSTEAMFLETGNNHHNASFLVFTSPLSSGNHSICLTAWVSGGATLTFPLSGSGTSSSRNKLTIFKHCGG